MMDFEPGLQNSIRYVFPKAKISGCFFHYAKILWGKAKQYGLCTRKEIKYTKILLFILKLMPYMNINERDELLENIEQFFDDNNNGKYAKLLKYYKKKLNYIDLTEKNI